MLYCNLSGNGRFAVPGGLPATLSAAGETVAEGVLPKGAGGLSATVVAVRGVEAAGDGSDPTDSAPATASVHLALYEAPTALGGSDGVQVGETSSISGLGAIPQTIAISTPDTTTTAPAVYVWRLWAETQGTNGVELDALEAR